MDMWLDLLQEAGPVVAAICFFVWRDWKREQNMTESLNERDHFIKTQLLEIIERTVVAVQNSTDAMRDLQRSVSAMYEHCQECGGAVLTGTKDGQDG